MPVSSSHCVPRIQLCVTITVYTMGSSCLEDAGLGTGMMSLGRLRVVLPEWDKAAATISALAVAGCFCFGSNRLCFHAAFRTTSKESIAWVVFLLLDKSKDAKQGMGWESSWAVAPSAALSECRTVTRLGLRTGFVGVKALASSSE